MKNGTGGGATGAGERLQKTAVPKSECDDFVLRFIDIGLGRAIDNPASVT
jgi:hypothetical protein